MSFEVTAAMLLPRGVPSGHRACPPVDADRMFCGSDYGLRTLAGHTKFHAGLDFNGDEPPNAWPVFAVADGVVRFVFCEVWPADAKNATTGYGNCVLVEHPQLIGPRGTPWCSFYAHLADYRVAVGDRVTAGQHIARIGVSRNGIFHSMGYHEHFEFRNLKRSTYNNIAPDWLPGNNKTIFGSSGEAAYRPGPDLNDIGTTCDPITLFKALGIEIAREPIRDASGAILRRRGFIALNAAQGGFNSIADPTYAPRMLPPTSGWAFGPVMSSEGEISSRRARLRSMASSLSGLGSTIPGYLAAFQNAMLAADATSGGVVTPSSSSGVAPGQSVTNVPMPAGTTPPEVDSGYVNLIVPETNVECLYPAAGWAYGALVGAAAGVALALGVIWKKVAPQGLRSKV
jgi:hypothetical protein